ncbi:MAG: prepilin-type N-terminal cleavage/methylation domain-containing protein [Candidatus Pacebacteria bacterium]|nr:prepilin-type N-terminal cleavage/methylation domain-containing protein [Candidatus Paceibacterota bacterium]
MHFHRRKPISSSSSAFTLIELLVVIAIIAILAVVVVLTLNPAQLLAQSRDANRVSDMATLNTALGLYSTDTGGVGKLGTSTLVYTSFSDTSSTCGTLGLPSLPASSTYNCTPSTSTRAINGSGWIPINFQNISAGAPFGSLPIDPVNTSSSGLFYAYSTQNGQFEVTAIPESQKQKASLGAKPIIPNYPDVIANGSNLTLSPLYSSAGLVGYWPMDEGNGSTTIDQSGNGNGGTWYGTPGGTNSTYYVGGKVGNYAGYFNGGADGDVNSNYIGIGVIPNLTAIQSIVAWAFSTNSVTLPTLFSEGGSNHEIDLYGSWRICDNGNGCGGPPVIQNIWSFVVVTFDGSNEKFYLNGVMVYSQVGTTINTPAAAAIGAEGPQHYRVWNGLIDDVRVYNRALSPAEIQALYNAEK